MGIIQKQAVRTTTVIFAGMIAGILTRLSMPFILSKEEIGVLALLDSVSNLLSTIFCLGFIQIAIRLFPRFRNDETGHNGFLMFGVIVSLVGFVLGLLTFQLLQSSIFGEAGETGLLRAFSYLVIPLLFWRILFKNMDAYMRMLFSTVVGATLESFILKALLLFGLIAFWMEIVDYGGLVYLYVFALSLPGVLITILAFQRTPKITLPTAALTARAHRKDMLSNGLFGVLASASAILVLSIDQIMMVQMLSVEDVGVYSVLFFAGVMVNVPGRGVKRIAMPVLAEAWKSGNLEEVQSVYQKSSITNLVTGLFLFVVGWACLGNVLTYLPDYQYAAYVFFYIGLGQVVDMMTGVNMEIIASSDRYRTNTYFNAALAVLVIAFNLWLIPLFGVVGSAMASCLAMVVVNAARWFYLKRVFGLQPFDSATLWTVGLGGCFLGLAFWDPLWFHPLWNTAMYAVGITIVYWLVIVRMNISPDINHFVMKLKRRFFPAR